MSIHHIALITSCIKPNTLTGPITNFSLEERTKCLVENLNYLHNLSIFKTIYIIDPYIKDSERISKFDSMLKNNGLENVKPNYLIFNPSKEIRKNILNKGKGYSELAMIITCLKKIRNNNKNEIIHKISGRYKILNLKKIIKVNEVYFRKNIILNIPLSNLLRKCYCVLFSFKSNIDKLIFSESMNLINDNKGKYLENSIYKILKEQKVTYSRNRILPRFENTLLGGSKQGRYTLRKQILNSIIYKFF